MSARRRRLRGAWAREGVRGMARGLGEAVARAAGDNRGRRSRVHGMGRRRGKRERARYGRRQRKDGHDEWNQMLEIGCPGHRKDFRELGFRF